MRLRAQRDDNILHQSRSCRSQHLCRDIHSIEQANVRRLAGVFNRIVVCEKFLQPRSQIGKQRLSTFREALLGCREPWIPPCFGSFAAFEACECNDSAQVFCRSKHTSHVARLDSDRADLRMRHEIRQCHHRGRGVFQPHMRSDAANRHNAQKSEARRPYQPSFNCNGTHRLAAA